MIISPSIEELKATIQSRFPQPLTTLDQKRNLTLIASLQMHYWYAPELERSESWTDGATETQRVAVWVNREIPNVKDVNNWISPAIAELLANCAEKGATSVYISYSPETRQLLVRDDVIHTPEEITEILTRLNTEHVKSTKLHAAVGGNNGGVGIHSIRKNLKEIGGSLRYYESNGTIIAVIDWENEVTL